MTRKFKKGGYAALLSVIVIAAVIVLNMIINQLPQKVRQWDLSSSQIYSVGETTTQLLAELNKRVTVYLVADPGRVDDRIGNFVNRYADLSDNITVERVDPVLHPSRVAELEANTNTLLVVCEDTNKRKEISFDDLIQYDQQSYYYYGQMVETAFDGEGQLTSAISYVTTESQKMVYQTQGHQEAGLAVQVEEMLEKSNFQTGTVNLLTDGGIPEDCQLLLINGPETDLADDELTLIREYLDQGGNVMVFAGYSKENRPNLEQLMKDYGMELQHGLAADTKRFYQNNPYAIFPTYDTVHQVMQGISSESAALIINSGAMLLSEEVPEGIIVNAFLKTSDAGLLVDESGQTEGTYILGATGEKTLEQASARLTVITAPSLIDEGINTTFANLSNLTIFMNAVTTNFDDTINVSIPSKSLEITYNTIGTGIIWGPVFIIVIPLITLITGFVIWMRRRKL